MGSADITVSQLTSGRIMERIVLRLLRHWVAKNVLKGGQIMGIDLLFVDEQSVTVQGHINAATMHNFESCLEEGAVYVLSGFDVIRSALKYRVSDFHLSLRFNATTSFIRTAEPVPEIPKQVFRFRTMEELAILAKTSKDLPDVMGQVCSTKAFHDGVTNVLRRMLVLLQIESGEKVRLTAFDDEAVKLSKVLRAKHAEFCILLATNVNPRTFSGTLYLNTTAGTRFFLNDEVEATKKLTERLQSTDSLQRCSGVQKIESVSIAEMNNFVVTAVPQEIEYLCAAKVIEVQSGRGWSFISCSACGRKLQKGETTLTCTTCNTPAVVGDVRYRVEFVVEDHSARAVFVVFDGEMKKLTGVEASELAAQVGNGSSDGDAGALPAVISDLIGKTFTFHLRLTNFNFTSYHESFTVSRVYKDEREVPKPKFRDEDVSTSCSSDAAYVDGALALSGSVVVKHGPETKKQKIV